MSEIIAFRRFAKLPEHAIKIVHSPFVPAEVYQTDPIKARLSLRDKGVDFDGELPVFRLSPLGVEIDLSGAKEQSALLSYLQPGKEIDLTISLGKHPCDFFGLVVATRHREGDKDLFGVRWCQQEAPLVGTDRRQHRRWLCGEEFLPTGIAPNPTRFNDFIYFKVIDISNGGMQISTSLRNKFLIPGMQLETMSSFPLVGQLKLILKAKHARIRAIDGKDFLVLGTTIVDADHKVLETIGQYLLQFSKETTDVESLRKQGFYVRSVRSALSFSFVKTAADYRQVLELRKLAYAGAGKMKSEIAAEETGDIFDSRARIITARHGSLLVGSLRLIFHEPGDQLEHEQFIELPSYFPRKDEIVEATRVCTHPDYRGSDLFYALMKQMMLTSIQSKRRWILGSSTPKLLPLYKKIGFKPSGVLYRHASLGNEPHELLLADVPTLISGVGVGPTLWNELYSDVSDYLSELHEVEFDALANLRMSLYRSVSPLTTILSKHVRNPRKSRK